MLRCAKCACVASKVRLIAPPVVLAVPEAASLQFRDVVTKEVVAQCRREHLPHEVLPHLDAMPLAGFEVEGDTHFTLLTGASEGDMEFEFEIEFSGETKLSLQVEAP